jgi:hypothetical protein
MGVVDTALFVAAERALQRQSPPAEARAAVAFLRGLAGYDYAAVSRASRPLIEAARRGDDWLPADLLRTGAVVAALETGDVRSAREAMAALTPRSSLDANDVRAQMLWGWIEQSERMAGQGAPR